MLHVDIIIAHHVNLRKTQSTQDIALLWAGLKHQCSPWHYYGQDTSINTVHHVTSNKTKINRVHQQWRIQAVCEIGIPFREPKLWRPQLYFNRKYVEVVINGFIMYLIISKWLKIQKYKLKSKTMSQRHRSERRNCRQKCFHSFNYLIDHASIRFFFYVVYTASCDSFCTTYCIF